MYLVYFHPDKFKGYGATREDRWPKRIEEQKDEEGNKLDVTKAKIIKQGLTLKEADTLEIKLQKENGYEIDTIKYSDMLKLQKLTLRPDIVKKRGKSISKALKGKPCNPNAHSPEANLKRSLAKKGKVQYHMLTPQAQEKRIAKRIKPVIQMTKQGKYVKKWNSIKQAAEANNTYASQISNCIAKKFNVKSAGGFKWKYA